MKIQEFYQTIGGDYNTVSRMLMTESRIQKFVMKFLDDPSFHELTQALEADQTQTAFRAAHTLKGVTGNLSLTGLYRTSAQITEMLRAGNLDEAKEYYPQVKNEYEKIASAAQQLTPIV